MFGYTGASFGKLATAAVSLLALTGHASAADDKTQPELNLTRTVTASQLLIDKYYDQTGGLFNKQWWNSAVVLTQLADLETYKANTTKPTVPELLANTFAKDSRGGYINGFYDDEGWWALAWIAAWDLTHQDAYLQRAADIWWDMKGGWRNDTCGGGLWWDKKHSSEASISNALFLSVSAHLARRVDKPDNKTMYTNWARTEWAWMHDHVVNATGNTTVVRDGINKQTCQPSNNEFTYTQGVVIGALLEMHIGGLGNGDGSLIRTAGEIARSVIFIKRFNDANGILTEPVGGYNNDLSQFKGIFMRNLRLLQRHAPNQAYVDYARKQAESMWTTARDKDGLVAPQWDSLKYPSSMSSHSSAIAGLLAGDVMGLSCEEKAQKEQKDDNSKPTRRARSFKA